MPLVLYGHRMSPPFRSVVLTARIIGVDVEEKSLDMHEKQEHKTEAFLKMNPTHTIPTLDDDGFYLWESRAIMGYLVQQYAEEDSLYPKEPKKRAVVDNMLYFDADCLFSSIQHYLAPVIFRGEPEDPHTKSLVVERMGFLNTILKDRKYVAGDQMTIADISIMGSLSVADILGFRMEDFPGIETWAVRIRAEMPFYDEVTQEGIKQVKEFLAAKLRK